MNLAINLAENGYVPDPLLRQSMRWLIRRRLQSLPVDDCERAADLEREFVALMDASPIAVLPEKANEQHYELPARFFELCLGSYRKYSCCYWPENVSTLDQAERAALEQTVEHAALADGQSILELGCGWGSLTLYMAKQYPNASITAVSNSASQREFIERRLRERGLNNVQVLTRDMNDFQAEQQYDRVVSVEMFEHMRNYRELFARIASWLQPGGQFFMHIFCHRSTPYLFEDRGAGDWMTRHFFSGGMMPSDNLPLHFQDELKLQQRWRWDGRHYQKTSEAWLQQMDSHRDQGMRLLSDTYGEQQAQSWWMRWRMFYLAVAELFGTDNGQQWWVSHYRFARQESGEPTT